MVNVCLAMRGCLWACMVLMAVPSAQAFPWPWKKKPDAVEERPLLMLGEFRGSSGESARRALETELRLAERFEVKPIESAASRAGYFLSGESTGGRLTALVRGLDGKLLFERNYAAPGLDENLRAFADDLVFALTGLPGIAQSRIAFVSDVSGSKQIYLCDPDGGNVVQVTRHRHGAVSPALSPDGDLLAFTSYRSGYPELMLLDLAGGMERVVTDTPGANFGAAFAPTGRHLALVLGFLGNPEIFVTDIGSGEAACLTESTGVPCSPAWAPDGRRLIFSMDEGQGQQFVIADLGSEKSPGGVTRWNSGYRFVVDAAWAPTGEMIAFTARTRGSYAVITKKHPSGSSKVICRGAQHPSWSPDARFLVYVQAGRLMRHELATGLDKVLVSGLGSISEPYWRH
jgi:TolB protein